MECTLPRCVVLLLLAVAVPPVFADTDLAAAIASNAIDIRFFGTGGSSGDSIVAKVRLRETYGGTSLDISVAPGTQLLSGRAGEQNMVISRLRGRMTNAVQFEVARTIRATRSEQTFVFEAFCLDMELDNPAATTVLSVGTVDPILTCIVEKGGTTLQTQAAIWYLRSGTSQAHFNSKFDGGGLDKTQWAHAVAIATACAATK